MFLLIAVSIILCYIDIHASQVGIIREVKMERYTCKSFLCQSTICNVSKPNRNTQLMNLQCYLPEEQKSVRAHWKLFYRYNVYRPFLLDFDADLCEFLAGKGIQTQLAKLVVPLMANTSNLLGACPLKGMLWIKDYRMDMKTLRLFQMPSGQYRVDSKFYNDITNQTILQSQLFVTISSNDSMDKSMWG